MKLRGGAYNVVKYSSDHGDAVQTDINKDIYGRPEVEFTVDRHTRTVTVTELNPANGDPLTNPRTGKPYQEVITETPSGSFRKSGNLPTQGDSGTGFTVSLIKAPPSDPMPLDRNYPAHRHGDANNAIVERRR
jgi:hypothetical protein